MLTDGLTTEQMLLKYTRSFKGPDGGTGNIRIAVDASIKSETRIIFFAGSPLREPVCAEGPFVMNTHAEIVQAHREYLAGLLH